MRHVSVPITSARVGDVLERDPSGGPEAFAVVTRVVTDGQGNLQVHSVGAEGESKYDACPSGSVPGMVDRVGEGCAPTPAGLRAFIAEWLRLPPAS